MKRAYERVPADKTDALNRAIWRVLKQREEEGLTKGQMHPDIPTWKELAAGFGVTSAAVEKRAERLRRVGVAPEGADVKDEVPFLTACSCDNLGPCCPEHMEAWNGQHPVL